jgi:regulator of replication initiation timing
MDINRDIEDLKKAIRFVMDDDERLYLVAKRLSKLLKMKREESNNTKYKITPLGIRFRDKDGKWHHVQLDDR